VRPKRGPARARPKNCRPYLKAAECEWDKSVLEPAPDHFTGRCVETDTGRGELARRGLTLEVVMSQFVPGVANARFLGLDVGDWSVLVGGGCALAGLVLFLA
jgi:hypothetical protein